MSQQQGIKIRGGMKKQKRKRKRKEKEDEDEEQRGGKKINKMTKMPLLISHVLRTC